MEFNLETFKKLNLSPNQFILLYALIYKEDSLYQQLKDKLGIYCNNVLFQLQKEGYIKLDEDFKPILRKKALDLKGNDKKNPKVRANNILDKFRELFPTGSNNGGYRYRGDKQGCLNKLELFFKDNPDYTDEEVLQATKNYIDRFKPTYQGMRQAHYFIKKDKVSDLLGELEGLNEIPKKSKSRVVGL